MAIVWDDERTAAPAMPRIVWDDEPQAVGATATMPPPAAPAAPTPPPSTPPTAGLPWQRRLLSALSPLPSIPQTNREFLNTAVPQALVGGPFGGLQTAVSAIYGAPGQEVAEPTLRAGTAAGDVAQRGVEAVIPGRVGQVFGSFVGALPEFVAGAVTPQALATGALLNPAIGAAARTPVGRFPLERLPGVQRASFTVQKALGRRFPLSTATVQAMPGQGGKTAVMTPAARRSMLLKQNLAGNLRSAIERGDVVAANVFRARLGLPPEAARPVAASLIEATPVPPVAAPATPTPAAAQPLTIPTPTPAAAPGVPSPTAPMRVNVKNTRAVSNVFGRLVEQDRSTLEGVLANWSNVALSADGTRLSSHAGREPGTKNDAANVTYNVTKQSFLDWLYSEAPFDPKEFVQYSEWVADIQKLRALSGVSAQQPTIPAPTTVPIAPVQPTIPDFANTQEAEAFGRQHQGNAQVMALLQAKRDAYLRLADDQALSQDLRFQAAQAAQLPREALEAAGQTVQQPAIPALAHVPTATVSPAKQPWEMTREEFAKSKGHNPADLPATPLPLNQAQRYPITRDVDLAREAAVRAAVKVGHPVPPTVLAEYPGLRPQQPPVATPPAQPALAPTAVAPVPPRAAMTTPSPAKQPWEMTALEYARSKVPGALAPGGGLRAQHRVEVKAALSAGQPVPPAVLAEHPDLAKTVQAATPPGRISQPAEQLPSTEQPVVDIATPHGPSVFRVKQLVDYGRGAKLYEIVSVGPGGNEPAFPGVERSPTIREFFERRITHKLVDVTGRTTRESKNGFIQTQISDAKFLRPVSSVVAPSALQRPVRVQQELPGMAAPTVPTTALRPTTSQATGDLLVDFQPSTESQPSLFSTPSARQDALTGLKMELAGLHSLPQDAATRQRILQKQTQIAALEEKLAGGVAEGTPAYGQTAPIFYSQLERAIAQKMPNRAPVAQVRGLLASAGVKQDELVWVLGDYLTDKAVIQKNDLLQHIRANTVQVQEVVHGGEPQRYYPDEFLTSKMIQARNVDDWATFWNEYSKLSPDQQRAIREVSEQTEDPKFAAYQLPGGTNYREVFLTAPRMPTLTLEEYFATGRLVRGDSGWDRVIQFTPPTGSRDWSVEVVAVNPDGTPKPGEQHRVHATAPDQSELSQNWHDGHADYSDIVNPIVRLRINEREGGAILKPGGPTRERILFIEELQPPVKAEQAKMPRLFAKPEHFIGIAVKRMLRYAAEGGYDVLAWTTGEQQAARYDLSKQIDKLVVRKHGPIDDYYFKVVAWKDGKRVIEQDASREELPRVVGKDLAAAADKQPYVANRVDEAFIAEGQDLKVGGEGMKAFYDVMLPSAVNRIVKRFGGRVGTTTIKTSEKDGWGRVLADVHAVTIPPALRQSALHEGFAVFDKPQPGGTLPTGGARGNAPAVQPAQGPMPAPVLAETHPRITEGPIEGYLRAYGRALPDGHQSVPIELVLPREHITKTGLRFPHYPLTGGLRVIPITRAESDALQGVFVQFSDGHQGSATFQAVPDAEVAGATGLQYFYKYDLPAGTATPYPATTPASIQQTLTQQEMGRMEPGGGVGEGAPADYNAEERAAIQGEPTAKPTPLTPELRRRLAAYGLTQADVVRLARALFRQTRTMQTESQRLQQAILENGGLKPFAGGVEAEEFTRVPLRLRRTAGLPLDEMADALKAQGFPYEGSNDLLAAISEIKQLPTLTVKDFLPQAEETIFSNLDPKTRQALIEAKPLGQQMLRLRRSLRTDFGQQISKLVADAQAKRLTPRQVSQLAKLYRVQPGQTVTGPKGGVSPAPLSPADVRKVGAVVQTVRGPRGQPTGTPPIIPRGRGLIPHPDAHAKPARDLDVFEGAGLSGLDPSRAAMLVDGKNFGPTGRAWEAVRRGEVAMLREQSEILHTLAQVARQAFRTKAGRQNVGRALEATVPAGAPMPAHIRATSDFLRTQYDQLIDAINVVRERKGLTPVQKRENYLTHTDDPSFWAQLKEGLQTTPEGQGQTLGWKAMEALRKTPFSRFLLPRSARPKPYTLDALAAFRAYLGPALRVKHLTEPAALMQAHINQYLATTPRAQGYFADKLSALVTGSQGPVARRLPAPVLRGIKWLSSRFAAGVILGNLSPILAQPLNLSVTMGLTSPSSLAFAASWLPRGGLAFAEQFSLTVQGRHYEADADFMTLQDRINAPLGVAFSAVDRGMVSLAFLDGYHYAVTTLHKDFAGAVEYGDLVAQRSQGSFIKSDLPPIFSDAFVKEFLKFQTSINAMFNAARYDLPRQPHPWAASAWAAGALLGIILLYKKLGVPVANEIKDFIPGVSSLRGGPPVTRIASALFHVNDTNPLARAKARRELVNAGFAVVSPYAMMGKRIVAGATAVARGGQVNQQGRVQFPVRGGPEAARAIAFGPYQTKAGQAYIRRGFTPPPLTPAEQAARAQRRSEQQYRRRQRPVVK